MKVIYWDRVVFCVQRFNFRCKIGCEKFGCLMSDLETSRSNPERSSPKQIATSKFQNNYFPQNLSMQSSLFQLKKSTRDLQVFLFFKQHFYEQQQAKIGKK